MIKSWTWLIAELQAERAAMFRVAPVWVQERLDSSALEWKQSSLRHRDERIYCRKAFVFSGMVERRRRYVRQCRRKLQPPPPEIAGNRLQLSATCPVLLLRHSHGGLRSRLIQFLDRIRIELQLGRLYQVRELLLVRRARNWGCNARLYQQPGQRHTRHR
jgi:hypothetical protein